MSARGELLDRIIAINRGEVGRTLAKLPPRALAHVERAVDQVEARANEHAKRNTGGGAIAVAVVEAAQRFGVRREGRGAVARTLGRRPRSAARAAG